MQAIATNIWPLVLTSAGVGAAVSAGITLLGQGLERRARKRELLLSKAIEMAQARTEKTIRIWEKAGGSATFQDEIVSAETYFQWLLGLWQHGKLPDDPRIERLRPPASKP